MQETSNQPSKPNAEMQENQDADKTKHSLALLEAALYVAGKPMDVNELCAVLSTRSKKKVKKLASTLIRDYATRNTALEILELKDERYVLQLKADYTPLVKKLVNRPLLSSGPLKTLSYIAYRQPVTQKRVIEIRGQHAYGHIKLLKDMGLIAAEKSGRSMALKTTDYFADYFGLLHDTALMKKELKRTFGDAFTDQNKS